MGLKTMKGIVLAKTIITSAVLHVPRRCAHLVKGVWVVNGQV